MSSLPQRRSRFGNANSHEKFASSSSHGPPSSCYETQQAEAQILHVPLYNNGPGFAFSDINLSDYIFYLLPVKPETMSALTNAVKSESGPGDLTTLSQPETGTGSSSASPCAGFSGYFDASTSMSPSLNLSKQSAIAVDVENMYWNDSNPGLNTSTQSLNIDAAAGVPRFPSSHELLLQNLVESAAKFTPVRFSDVRSAGGEELSTVLMPGEQGSAVTSNTMSSHPKPPPRERKPDQRPPRNIAQASLRAVLNQPPPTFGTSYTTSVQPIDLFSPSVHSHQESRRLGMGVRGKGKENMMPRVAETRISGLDHARTQTQTHGQMSTPVKLTSAHLQSIALMHYNLAHPTSPNNGPVRSCTVAQTHDDSYTLAFSKPEFVTSSSGSSDDSTSFMPSPLGPGPGYAGLSLDPPLDSWEDICSELKALEVLRRDMMTMLNQSTQARSVRAGSGADGTDVLVEPKGRGVAVPCV